MSKATSTRGRARRDWLTLLQALRDEQARVTPEAEKIWLDGRWSDPRPSWGEQYLDAIQRALEARDSVPLLKMLDAGVPLPEVLLPTLAEVIRDLQQGGATGAPKKLLALDDEQIRSFFAWATTHGNMSSDDAKAWLADIKRVSAESIKRALQRSKR